MGFFTCQDCPSDHPLNSIKTRAGERLIFWRVNCTINYFNHALIAVLKHISFVLCYSCRGNECPERGGDVSGCVCKLFTHQRTDATLSLAVNTDGRILGLICTIRNIIHSFRTEIFLVIDRTEYIADIAAGYRPSADVCGTSADNCR